MHRRDFLKTSIQISAAAAVAGPALARGEARTFDPRPGPWRTWDVTTRIQVLEPRGVSRVWVPLPGVYGEYQQTLGDRWSGNARLVQLFTDPVWGAPMLYAEFAEGEPAPTLEVVSRVRTRSRMVDWSQRRPVAADPAELRRWTEPTELMPTDGIVRETAEQITQGRSSDLDKARAVYDWILANTYREPKVRGCGVGDIKTMLETRNFGGKCGDINALFVGLLRAVGVPARDVYGIRVAPSEFGYKSLGAASANISKAQHCRAEVFLRDYGWVAMDPADVTKVAREETAEWLPIDHPVVAAVRPKLFGGWEGNWMAYNMAHDVALPRSAHGGRLGFLMYPQAETADGRRDSLDPEGFRYTISAQEVAA